MPAAPRAPPACPRRAAARAHAARRASRPAPSSTTTCCASTARHDVAARGARRSEATARGVQVRDDTDQPFDRAQQIDRARGRARDCGSRATCARLPRAPTARRATGTGARTGARAPIPWRARARAGTCRRTAATPSPRKRRAMRATSRCVSPSSRAARTTALLSTARRRRPAAALGGTGGPCVTGRLSAEINHAARSICHRNGRPSTASPHTASSPGNAPAPSRAHSTIATIGCDDEVAIEVVELLARGRVDRAVTDR